MCWEDDCCSLVGQQHFARGRRLFFWFSCVKKQDNYTAAIGSGEVVTGEERAETVAFIEAIMATPCMQYAHKYLASKGQAPESETGFKVCVCVRAVVCV